MRRDIWLFIFALGLAFFTWPLLSIFRNGLVPALFIIWLVFIALIWITTLFTEQEKDEH